MSAMESPSNGRMKEKWNALIKSPFLARVTQLISGEAFAVAVGFAVMPLITRIYGPATLGLLGVFMAISEVLGRIATLRFDLALVLPESEGSAWALFKFSILFSLGLTLALCISTLPFWGFIASSLGTPELAIYFPVLASMTVAIAWQSLASYWVMRAKAFKSIAFSSAASSVLGNTVKVVVGLAGLGSGGLLLGTVIQRWSNFLLILITSPKSLWKHSSEKGAAWKEAKARREFPLYRMPQDTLNSVTRHLPAVLLASFYSPVAAGFYILAWRTLNVPMAVLQLAIRKVFYVKALDTSRSGGSLYRICLQMTLLIAAILLPVVLLSGFFGERAFEIGFGQEWTLSGQYAKWVLGAAACTFASVPSQVVIPIIGWNAFFLAFEIVSTVLRLGVVVLAAIFLDEYSTVVAICLGASVSALVLTTIILIHLARRPVEPLNNEQILAS